MKLRSLMKLIAAIAMVLFFASCKKTNQQGRLIPADAGMVMHINGQSISSKLPWDEIKGNALFQKLYADSTVPAFVKKILDNPENSGINVEEDLMMFVKQDSLGTLIGLEGTVKDAEKFKLFNLDLVTGGNESDKGDVHYISNSPKICVGWNKGKFVYLVNSPGMGRSRFGGNYGGMSELKSRDMMLACKDVFDLKEDNSLGSNEKFTALMKKEGDVHFWINSEALMKGAGGGMAMLNMLKMDKLYEGSVTVGTLNFESGKMTVDFKSYSGKTVADLLKKYSGSNVSEDMLKRIPAKDVGAVIALNFKPEGIKELLKLFGVDGLANIALAQAGFTLDDFVKANKGDVLISIGDFKTRVDSAVTFGGDGTVTKTTPEYLFSASIGDKESFNKLIEAGKKLAGTQAASLSELTFSSNANYFALGNSKEKVDKYLAGTNNNFGFISKLTGSPVGMYVNMQYILKSFQAENAKDSSAKVVMDESLKMWDNIYMTGGKFSDGGISYTVEIDLVDKSTNSLKQLNSYIAKLSTLAIERQKKYDVSDVQMQEIMTDTTSVPPPPPPVKANK